MSRLHERDEPLPYFGLPRMMEVFGPRADAILCWAFRAKPSFGIIRCDGCGRWQDFDPPHTFAAMRMRASAVGWKRDGERDLCPICVGN